MPSNPCRAMLALLAGSVLTLHACGSGVSAALPTASRPQQETLMKIRMDVDGQVVLATLDNSAPARDLAALLPLSLTLTDYARIERIADLPRKLSLEGTAAGVAGMQGDITFYAPWGNLAILVADGDGKPARGLVRLGRIESGLPALQRSGPLSVRIERNND